MTLRELQRDAVDTIKRHALVMSLRSPRAQAYILTEYLWTEETTEAVSLEHAVAGDAPTWLGKLITAQLSDEHRHAALLRTRLADLRTAPRPPPKLSRAKLWWLERATAPYASAFAAGPIVVLLAAAAQFEATGVRILSRHLDVLEARERASNAADPTADVVRSILSDEQRHARSCAAAALRLVRADERAAFEALQTRVATIDRAFGITLAVRYWVLVAALAAADRVRMRREAV
jgi:hypothetical protein